MHSDYWIHEIIDSNCEPCPIFLPNCRWCDQPRTTLKTRERRTTSDSKVPFPLGLRKIYLSHPAIINFKHILPVCKISSHDGSQFQNLVKSFKADQQHSQTSTQVSSLGHEEDLLATPDIVGWVYLPREATWAWNEEELGFLGSLNCFRWQDALFRRHSAASPPYMPST